MQGYMPVLQPVGQAAPQAAVAPSTEQPVQVVVAPVDPAQVETAKKNVEKAKKRVKFTSFCLMAIGAIGMGMSVYYQFTARHQVMKVIQGPGHGSLKHHQGNHHGEMNHTAPPTDDSEHALPKRPEYITIDEFYLYDAIKTMAWLTFFLFAKILALGKCGRWITWCNKSGVTRRILRKSCFGFICIAILAMIATQQRSEMDHLIQKIHENRNSTLSPVVPEGPRNLYKAMEPMTFDKENHESEMTTEKKFLDEVIENIQNEEKMVDEERKEFEQDPYKAFNETFKTFDDTFKNFDNQFENHFKNDEAQPEHHKHHGFGMGHGGKSGRQHHGYGQGHHKPHESAMCCWGFLLVFLTAVTGTHFAFIKCLKKKQQILEKLTGAKSDWSWGGCGKWKKRCGQTSSTQQQPTQTTTVPVQQVNVERPTIYYSATLNDSQSSISIIHDEQDKVESPPTNINSSTVIADKNIMI